jgi:hypothetical protein
VGGQEGSKLDQLFVPLLGKCLRVMVPVVGVILALPVLGLPAQYAGLVAKGTSILLIVAVALISFQAVGLGEKVVLMKFDIGVADNLRARKIHTQLQVISKTLYILIGLFTVASILMLFQEVRHLGTSILASAGVVGVILGFAAQKTIANLFAGFQIALAQPIRMDDVVIVEGEWGRIEEITLTYVVVHIWDDRRLIVPLSDFIEKPFQNWTRVSAQLLGIGPPLGGLLAAFGGDAPGRAANRRSQPSLGPPILEFASVGHLRAHHANPCPLHRRGFLQGVGLALRSAGKAHRFHSKAPSAKPAPSPG